VDPTATGRANFAFISRYQNGKNVPTGNAEFLFTPGGLKFRSTTYEWLVVSGRHALCKGTGTINGSGDYHFMLTSIDGDQPGGGRSSRRQIPNLHSDHRSPPALERHRRSWLCPKGEGLGFLSNSL